MGRLPSAVLEDYAARHARSEGNKCLRLILFATTLGITGGTLVLIFVGLVDLVFFDRVFGIEKQKPRRCTECGSAASVSFAIGRQPLENDHR